MDTGAGQAVTTAKLGAKAAKLGDEAVDAASCAVKNADEVGDVAGAGAKGTDDVTDAASSGTKNSDNAAGAADDVGDASKAADNASDAGKAGDNGAGAADDASDAASKNSSSTAGADGGNSKGGTDDVVGGAHRDTKKPANDGQDSHHCPEKSCYKNAPMSENDGPAIKMDPVDHKKTASHGSNPDAVEYRKRQTELLNEGKVKEAQQMDIDDIRKIEQDIGEPGKYDKGIEEMVDYTDTLDPDDFKNK